MRLFIAVDIDQRVRREIDQIQRGLRQKTGLLKGPVKWVEPNLIHLTLKFLGQVPDQSISQICRLTEETAKSHMAFEIRVQGLGTFGRPPRVLWAGIEDCPALVALQKDLEERLEKAGWPREERAFSAHLTLCRIKEAKAGIQLGQAVEGQHLRTLGSVPIEQMIVYESQLQSGGPVYTAVARYDLKKTGSPLTNRGANP
jgi:2'-5' RNA ligase